MKRVDKLGRIVVPIELRQKYGMTEGREVEFLDSGDGVTVKCAAPFCRLCRAKISVSKSLGKREQSEPALKPEFSALSALVTLAKSYLAASAKHQNHLKIKALEFSEFLR